MSNDLDVLAEHRDALLLAEVAAWLHDMGKCRDEHVDNVSLCPSSKNEKYDYKRDYVNSLNIDTNFLDEQISFEYEKVVTIKELIEKGKPRSSSKPNEKWLIRSLGRCHASAHIEKEEAPKQYKQKNDNTWISTPFGYEYEKIKNLNSRLESIPFEKVRKREIIIKSIKDTFVHALGETRRPTNEVILDDWSGIVAALYKASLAGLLIEDGNEPDPRYLKWRFLSVRFDSEDIWGESSSIPILLSRKEWIEKGLDELKHLLEETYPLGNEVYRDENGSVFVVPDVKDLLDKKANSESEKTLKDLIIEIMPYDGEIQVNPTIEKEPWWGQYHDYKTEPEKNEVPRISSIISGDIPSISANPNDVEKWWDGKKCSICTVSHLRPADSRESNRNISNYWLEKISVRAKKWKKQQESTIWIDEVADSNGKICLLVGKLEIADWLKKDGYIRTLPFKFPDKDGDYEKFTKTPSFARISRVWRTTKQFWEEVKTNYLDKYRIEKRIKVFAEFKPEESNKLQINNSYEAISEDDIRFTIFYAGDNEYIIIENLELIAKKIKSKYKNSDKKAYELIKEYLRGRNLKIYDPDGKKRDKTLGSLHVSDIISEDANYVPVIPILAEPSIFMAIVPADKALDIGRTINKKYEEEMGKVRNRLPLTLGMVFAKSHTPISSVMDAGRRMLKNTSIENEWKVKSVKDEEPCYSGYKFRILEFDNGIEWKVPVAMRDGQTEDIWYPYFYINGNPEDCEKSFKGPDGWLVHASEIEKGDILRILPSTFDFEFLDSSSRRFEVYYDDEGKRWDKTKSLRPYLLEELDEFEKIWSIVGPKKFNRSQLKKVMYLLETKREEWPVEDEEIIPVFRNYVSDVLNNANWQEKPEKEDFDKIVNAAVTGRLKDIVELYMDILKIGENEKNDN